LAFLRTHILRPTWHFVLPEDLCWILALTSPRIISGMAARHRELGLDDPRLVNRACDVLAELLRDRNHLTRREIGENFSRVRRLPRPGQQLGHLLLLAELDGLICSGPMKGVHHSYALTEEVVPVTTAGLDAEEAHARLAQRFFAGHGPASIKDFTRWSSLTVKGTERALSEIGSALERVEIDGVAHWFDPATVARRSPAAPAAYLFPVYDEVVLTYPAQNFPALPDHPSSGRADPFWGTVVAVERNVGLWKRTIKRDCVLVEVRLAPSLPAKQRASIEDACRRLADFLQRDLSYSEADRPR